MVKKWYTICINFYIINMEERKSVPSSDYIEQQKQQWAAQRNAERAAETQTYRDPETGLEIEADSKGPREDETEVI